MIIFELNYNTFSRVQNDSCSENEEEEDSLNYEDNEDLESTISKLRQLLADKDSLSNETSTNLKIEYIHTEDTFAIHTETEILQKKLSDFQDLKLKIDPESEVYWDELSGAELAEVLEEWIQDPLFASYPEMKAFLEIARPQLPTEGSPEEKIAKKKGLAKKMTGMLNSIKDVFPTFEDEGNHGIQCTISKIHFSDTITL